MKAKIKFTSNKERLLWTWAVTVVIAIYATLFFGGQLIDFMIRQRVLEQSIFYLFLLLMLIFIISGLTNLSRHLGFWVYVGVGVVYTMALLRMDLSIAERSHIIEYGLLALLIYEALIERRRNGSNIQFPKILAVLIAGSIGVVDECIQYFIPYRVFDIVDIGFNFLASVLGVFVSFVVSRLYLLFKQ